MRCEQCAAKELGEPAPVVAARRRRLRAEHAVLALLLVAAAATIPPWHRSGTLTTRLSAWSFGIDGWAALGCAALALATVLALVAALRRSGGRRGLAPAVALSAISALATGMVLARAPGFFAATLAPYVTLGGTLGATLLGAFRLLRGTRP